ncbi:MAG: sugar isomerase [Haliscomenobacter sp.]|nr:sugar isomerase [Haliscomenobacter sp.]MBP9076427.1 sugar isomerase [Haliscomenobacter sp.]MBP9873952.1 sugar isomerase [Haliscomenobacter sp.]
MKIQPAQLGAHNEALAKAHQAEYDSLARQLDQRGLQADALVGEILDFQVAIPSWALGAGGTRFGRFSTGGEPANLEQKIEDVGLLHALTHSAGAISLHIPWDIPSDPSATREQAASLGIAFDAVNSNTFQDQPGQAFSYKFGSLCHTSEGARRQAIDHNLQVIEIGQQLGSKSITVWLADGASFPGQLNFRRALDHTRNALQEIYSALPDDWRLFIEYKPYEPNFYSMVVQDWGTSFHLAQACGEKAFTLVDLGHHLPNTNIEQIVSTLISLGKLGGFHFNDSKYGDDDLTVGSIKPYQLFLIFNELVYGMKNNTAGNPPLAWMIDASHNLKDPLEDLLQSLEAIRIAYVQALLVDQRALANAQLEGDVALCQEILHAAYRTDVRPILREARRVKGAALDPFLFYRQQEVRNQLIRERGSKTVATGL